ncbi:MAG TPA: hypothetical protein VF520_16460 [Thermoleophilaceae bacterium]|jgi:hypothetical protein
MRTAARPARADRATAQPSSRADSGPGAAADTTVPGPVATATAATFGALSRLRGARIFHPEGVGYSGVLRVERSQPGYAGTPLLGRPGEHRALFRLSRAVGLPEPLPDVLGLAVRLVDVHGQGRHQDFLLVTSADGPLLHHLLLPGLGGFFGQSFSSLLLYRFAGKLRLVGATAADGPHSGRDRGTLAEVERAAERGELAFDLAVAPVLGRWATIGALRAGERLPDTETEQLAFTPWNTGGGIRPVGPLMGLRRAAYRGSQEARGLDRAQIP